MPFEPSRPRVLVTARFVFRLSGTGTEGAMLRLYLERYDRENIDADAGGILKPLAEVARELLGFRERFGRERPTVIT